MTNVIHIPALSSPIPDGWRWSRLQDVCSLFDCPHSTPQLASDGPYIVRSQDIRPGVFSTDRAAHVSEKTYLDRTIRAVPSHGDLLFSREGTYFGIAAEVPANTKVCLGQRMVLLRPVPRVLDFQFLKYWINSPIMTRHVRGFRDGSVAERLNVPTIKSLAVVLPPIEEQRFIAQSLSILDQKIELNRRMNQTLEATARAGFKSWFVDYDSARAKANKFEDSKLGKIPCGWQVAELDDIVEVIDCLHSLKPARQQSGRPLIQLVNIRNDGLLDMTDTYFVSEQDYEVWISRMEAREGDCVITNVGRVAAVAQIPAGAKTALGRNMTGVRSIPRLRFVLPPTNVVKQFEGMCRPFRAKMEKNFEESITLTAIRDTLLPKLISGELRFRQAEKIVETHV
jgi:type I restriction enzyme S subunit